MRSLTAALLIAVSAGSSALAQDDPFDLVDAAERYCLSADGNHLATQSRAAADGFSPMSPDDIARVRLPGPQHMRGFSKMIQGVEVRVLTASVRTFGNNQGDNNFRICWVSADPWNRAPVDHALHRLLGIDRFGNGNAFVYAWTPQPDGSKRRINRREMDRTALRDALENDSRFVMSQDYEGMVAITYMVPTPTLDDGG